MALKELIHRDMFKCVVILACLPDPVDASMYADLSFLWMFPALIIVIVWITLACICWKYKCTFSNPSVPTNAAYVSTIPNTAAVLNEGMGPTFDYSDPPSRFGYSATPTQLYTSPAPTFGYSCPPTQLVPTQDHQTRP